MPKLGATTLSLRPAGWRNNIRPVCATCAKRSRSSGLSAKALRKSSVNPSAVNSRRQTAGATSAAFSMYQHEAKVRGHRDGRSKPETRDTAGHDAHDRLVGGSGERRVKIILRARLLAEPFDQQHVEAGDLAQRFRA